MAVAHQALPEGQFSKEITPYDGPFDLENDAGFTILGCDWSHKSQPMGEIYRLNPNATGSGVGDDETQIRALKKGAEVWTNAGADYWFNYGGTTASKFIGLNGQNIVFFEVNNIGLGASTIAATISFCNGVQKQEWDIVFNDLNFNFWDGETGNCNGRYDIQGIQAHELGHALGLGHSQDPFATMKPSGGPCDIGMRTLNGDDRNGIEFLYGTQYVSLPFSDQFPSTAIDTAKWIGIDGASANTTGINEPSAPYSLNLDGATDGGCQALRHPEAHAGAVRNLVEAVRRGDRTDLHRLE